MASPTSKRTKLGILRMQLNAEISSFLPHYRVLADNILPSRPRFTVSDTNKGDRRNQNIIDSSATFAVRTLRAGMMGGITSPARPWFRLTTPDPDLAEYGPVKQWLHFVAQRKTTIFLRSNLYNVLPMLYGDLSVFATSPMMVEEDFQEVIRCTSFPVGSYRIACDYRGRVNTFMREFRMTVRQLVHHFGMKDDQGKADWSKFSTHVKYLWDQGMYETWIDVCHVIQPNDDYDHRRPEAKFKRFSSCYFEQGSGLNTNGYLDAQSEDRYLRESGYDFFPVLCPRWDVTGEDAYGTACPGMDALGDIKQLQMGERRIAEAIEKLMRPPMVGNSALRTSAPSILPGGITYDDMPTDRAFRPAFLIDPRIQEMEGKQEQVRYRIRRAFFEDLFLMLASSDRREITAREVDERHEEKLLALGPVLEQLNQDLLDPLIDNTFDIMVRQGLVPPPPEEIQGMPLKVEYISIMAQAQKLVGVSGIERFAGFVGNLSAAVPSVLHKVDTDQLIDEYGDALGIAPRIIRTDEAVAEMRQGMAEQAAAQRQMEMTREGAAAAKDLSAAKTDDGKSVLNRMIEAAEAQQQEVAV